MKVGVGLGAYLEVAQTLRHFFLPGCETLRIERKIEIVCRKEGRCPKQSEPAFTCSKIESRRRFGNRELTS